MSTWLRHSLPLVRRSPAGLRLLLALAYVTIGLAGAWHAPHFSQGATAIGTDRHEHHEAVNAESCALCTVKNAPHQGGRAAVSFVDIELSIAAPAVVARSVHGTFSAFLARGPPALS